MCGKSTAALAQSGYLEDRGGSVFGPQGEPVFGTQFHSRSSTPTHVSRMLRFGSLGGIVPARSDSFDQPRGDSQP